MAVLKRCRFSRRPQSSPSTLGTRQPLVIDPTHYEGRSTKRVQAPPPLGRLGRRLLELAQEPVAHRSIDYYAALAEVAR